MMKDKFRSRLGLPAFVLIALMALHTEISLADDEYDHDRARQALEAGEILPLQTILERVSRDYPGQVMEIELERKDEGWRYEIKQLRPDGALVKLKVDARTGEVLGVKEKSAGHHPRKEGR